MTIDPDSGRGVKVGCIRFPPGAQRGLLQLHQDMAKQTLDGRILEWDTNAVAGECSGESEARGVWEDDREHDELGVQDIEVGEEACGIWKIEMRILQL